MRAEAESTAGYRCCEAEPKFSQHPAAEAKVTKGYPFCRARRRRAVDNVSPVSYPNSNMNEREVMRLVLVIDCLAAGY